METCPPFEYFNPSFNVFPNIYQHMLTFSGVCDWLTCKGSLDAEGRGISLFLDSGVTLTGFVHVDCTTITYGADVHATFNWLRVTPAITKVGFLVQRVFFLNLTALSDCLSDSRCTWFT